MILLESENKFEATVPILRDALLENKNVLLYTEDSHAQSYINAVHEELTEEQKFDIQYHRLFVMGRGSFTNSASLLGHVLSRASESPVVIIEPELESSQDVLMLEEIEKYTGSMIVHIITK